MAIDYAAINALTSQWGANKANMDDQENRLRINYNNVLDKMKRGLGENQVKMNESMADRGMLQSGASAKAQMDMRETFNRSAAQTAEKQNLDLATIARKRIEADTAYNTQKLLLQVPSVPGS